jgi:uncharacterized protein (DUF2141 family)
MIAKFLNKIVFSLFLAVFCAAGLFAQNQMVTVVVEVTNVIVNNGNVYLAIFFTADELRREEPSIAFQLDSTRTVLTQEVQLPAGEYVISAFQDNNRNKVLDFGLFGIPRELVGISNYFGRGFPSRDFNRQKIPINSTTPKVTIGLYKF